MTAYVLSTQATKDCDCWGLDPEQALYMLEHAAPITHEAGNWRFEDYLFDVDDDGQITGITKLEAHTGDAITCKLGPSADDLRYERECPVCLNDGGYCQVCNGTGHVMVTDTEYRELTSN